MIWCYKFDFNLKINKMGNSNHVQLNTLGRQKYYNYVTEAQAGDIIFVKKMKKIDNYTKVWYNRGLNYLYNIQKQVNTSLVSKIFNSLSLNHE